MEQTQGKTPSPGASTGRSATTGQGEERTPGKTVTLNSRQQTEIRSTSRNEPVENIDRVDFSVTTGTIGPEHVSIRPLPDRIVEIVPQYRGYDFVMVRHDIVIIDPQTRRIVTVLHGESRSAVNAPRGRLHLTGEQRQLIRRDLAPEGSAVHTEVQLGERVPEDISLLAMPATVVSDIPILRPYSYFMTDEDIVLVAPDTREIIEIHLNKIASTGPIDAILF